jgi:hypothetical protein
LLFDKLHFGSGEVIPVPHNEVGEFARDFLDLANRSSGRWDNASVCSMSFVDILPGGNDRAIKSGCSSGYKNDMPIKGRDLAFVIPIIGSANSDSAVRGYDDFLIREVDYPDGTVWDLSQSRIHDGQDKERMLFHLIVLRGDVSSLTSDAQSGAAGLFSHWQLAGWRGHPPPSGFFA